MATAAACDEYRVAPPDRRDDAFGPVPCQASRNLFRSASVTVGSNGRDASEVSRNIGFRSTSGRRRNRIDLPDDAVTVLSSAGSGERRSGAGTIGAPRHLRAGYSSGPGGTGARDVATSRPGREPELLRTLSGLGHVEGCSFRGWHHHVTTASVVHAHRVLGAVAEQAAWTPRPGRARRAVRARRH